MGAAPGNCNASKNKSLCKAKSKTSNKGWYNASGAKKYLYRQMDKMTKARRTMANYVPFEKKKRMHKSDFNFNW